jgi:hypothetical protein
MQTVEKTWNGKPLSELLTPWRAEANFILRQIGWYWYGMAPDSHEFFDDPNVFVFLFVKMAAEYDFEHGRSLSGFYRRLNEALERHKKEHGELPNFYNPIANALWRVGLAMSKDNLNRFFTEQEVRLIIRWGYEFVRRINLGYQPPFVKLPGLPPLDYFDGLRILPDIQTHELAKLI